MQNPCQNKRKKVFEFKDFFSGGVSLKIIRLILRHLSLGATFQPLTSVKMYISLLFSFFWRLIFFEFSIQSSPAHSENLRRPGHTAVALF